ncbi:hypothetical protein P175DRAFT_0503679, partial [Aspergillus ochraceoroseus IBT 24754]
MATVSITSDLEPYLASLRMYLEDSPLASESETELKGITPHMARQPFRNSQPERTCAGGGKNNRVGVKKLATKEDSAFRLG